MVTQNIAAMTQDDAATAISEIEGIDGLLGLDDEVDNPTEEEVTEETTAEETEEVDELEEDTDESEDEVEEETEEVEENPDEEVAEIKTLADLAEALEQDGGELEANLTTTIKVDGVESDVTLAELKSGYQREQDYTRKTMELSAQRKESESQYQALTQQAQQSNLIAGAVLQKVTEIFAGDMQSIEVLAKSDPQAAMQLKIQHDNRVQTLQQLQQNAANEYGQFTEQGKQHTTTELEELKRSEIEKLHAKIPDWSESKQSEMGKYFMDLGFTPEYLDEHALDHNFYVMADKAMKFDQQVATANPAVKKVRKLPKVQKPAARGTSMKATKLNKAKNRFRKNPTTENATAALLNSPGLDKMLGLE